MADVLIDDEAPATDPNAPEVDADSIQAAVTQAAQDAWNYIEEDFVPKWTKAIDYYHARPFGDEEDGRSKVVSTDVRDSIQATMPSLLRIFCGSEQAMAAIPRGAEDEQKAEEQTAFANLVFFTDNSGFRLTHDAILNALREGIGIFKVWWEETAVPQVAEHSGLSSEDMVGLLDDPEVELSDIVEEPPTGGEPTFRATVTRVAREGRIKVDVVPPEEFIVSRSARSLDKAPLIGHRRSMTASDLLGLGYAWDTIEGHLGAVETSDQMQQARLGRLVTPDADTGYQQATRTALYTELWMPLALDPNVHEARLYKVCALGENYRIIHIEPAPEVPFATLVPIPEPHTILGQSWADLTMDTQRIKSAIRRGTLDSLTLALHPRRVVLEGQVDMDDVLNTEMGAVIRERATGATRIEEHRFLGDATLPALEYEDAVKEARTGQSQTSQGLNAESMQSMTRLAGSAMLTAAHQRVEMLARIFAERDGFKRLYRLIVTMARRHQTRARTIRLRGHYVPVDPKNWDVDLDFEMQVGLGAGLAEERRVALEGILAQQAQVNQMLGPTNPITSFGRMRNTLAKLANLAGYPNADQFWKPVDDAAIDAAMAEEANKPPEPTPEQVLAQAQLEIERMKSEREFTIKGAELELKKQELELERLRLLAEQADKEADNERAQQQMVLDFEVKKAELEAKYAFDMEKHQMDMAAEAAKLRMELEAKAQAMGIEMDKADHDLAIKRAELALKGAEVAPTPREKKAATEEQSKTPPAPKRRKVTFTRDASGRVAGADISEE